MHTEIEGQLTSVLDLSLTQVEHVGPRGDTDGVEAQISNSVTLQRLEHTCMFTQTSNNTITKPYFLLSLGGVCMLQMSQRPKSPLRARIPVLCVWFCSVCN
jgi:hypothetical protein